MSPKAVPALTAHAVATDRTAIYPGAGSGSVAALGYVGLGLGGECAEVLEKDAAGDQDGLVFELGDVLWYVARFHRELALEPHASLTAASALAPVTGDPLRALVITVGRVQELVKKAVRDDAGTLSPQRRDALCGALAAVLGAWLDVHASRGLDPAASADANIAKLADRRSRHVLSGSGDYR